MRFPVHRTFVIAISLFGLLFFGAYVVLPQLAPGGVFAFTPADDSCATGSYRQVCVGAWQGSCGAEYGSHRIPSSGYWCEGSNDTGYGYWKKDHWTFALEYHQGCFDNFGNGDLATCVHTGPSCSSDFLKDTWTRSGSCPSGTTRVCSGESFVECRPSCTNDCSPSGVKRCAGSKDVEVCGEALDGDDCLEWRDDRTCGTGQRCVSGGCTCYTPQNASPSAPAQGTSILRSAIDSGSATFSWGQSPDHNDILNYWVDVSEDPNFGGYWNIARQRNTSVTLKYFEQYTAPQPFAFLPGHTYYWRVFTQTCGTPNTGSQSVVRSFTVVADPPVCTDDCSPGGATRCASSSAEEICGEALDGDDCLEWRPNRDCSLGQKCTAATNSCQCYEPRPNTLSSPSDNSTQSGAFTFSWNQSPDHNNINGYWVDVDDDGVFGSGTQSKFSGTNTSISSSQFTLAAGEDYYWRVYTQTCGTPNTGKHSPTWKFTMSGTCGDECLPLGLTRCLDNNTQQTCGQYDADSCSEWGDNTGCGTDTCSAVNACRKVDYFCNTVTGGCDQVNLVDQSCGALCPAGQICNVQGQCVGTGGTEDCLNGECSASCNLGLRCFDGNLKTQKCQLEDKNNDGVSKYCWSSPSLCPAGQRCSGADCLAQCTATNQRPVAVCNVNPTSGDVKTTFNFDGSDSHDPDGDPLTGWTWHFGDVVSMTTPGPKTTHKYGATGTYRPSLIVQDNKGAWDVALCSTVTVGEVACENECAPYGATECTANDTGYIRCGNYDTDACNEWSSAAACPANKCQDGACVDNRAPLAPPPPEGPSDGEPDQELTYKTTTTDPDGDAIRYTIFWGDDTSSQSGFVASGTTFVASHKWSSQRSYNVIVVACDNKNLCSPTGAPLKVDISKLVVSGPVCPRAGWTDQVAICQYATSLFSAPVDKCIADKVLKQESAGGWWNAYNPNDSGRPARGIYQFHWETWFGVVDGCPGNKRCPPQFGNSLRGTDICASPVQAGSCKDGDVKNGEFALGPGCRDGLVEGTDLNIWNPIRQSEGFAHLVKLGEHTRWSGYAAAKNQCATLTTEQIMGRLCVR